MLQIESGAFSAAPRPLVCPADFSLLAGRNVNLEAREMVASYDHDIAFRRKTIASPKPAMAALNPPIRASAQGDGL